MKWMAGLRQRLTSEARRRIGRRTPESGEESRRWLQVTVLAAPEVIAPDGRYPGPLADLGDSVELRMQPAPGDRGTELGARLREADPSGFRGAIARVHGDDPRQPVRAALRKAKQLIEVGEVLVLEPISHGTRKPLGRPLARIADRADSEGIL